MDSHCEMSASDSAQVLVELQGSGQQLQSFVEATVSKMTYEDIYVWNDGFHNAV